MTKFTSDIYRLAFKLGESWFYTPAFIAVDDEDAKAHADGMIDHPGYHFYGAKLEKCTNISPPYEWVEV